MHGVGVEHGDVHERAGIGRKVRACMVGIYLNEIPFGGFGPSWLLPRQSASPSLSQALALTFIHTVDPAGMVTGTAQAVSVAVIIPSNIGIVNQRWRCFMLLPPPNSLFNCEQKWGRIYLFV